MKSYIICLPQYPLSMKMARRALASALQHGWEAELWPGVDGRTVSLQDLTDVYGVHVNLASSKCARLMKQKSGVRGCFLSHWKLWHHCRDLDKKIAVFEHDVLIRSGPPKAKFPDILKLQGFDIKPARPAGSWYEGARAYEITPSGADKLITWVAQHGCLPADVCIGLDVVDIQLHDGVLIDLQILHENKISKHEDSFTWNLDTMKRQ